MNENIISNNKFGRPVNFINRWGPYVLQANLDEDFAKKLLEVGKKIPVEEDASKGLASRIKRVRYYKKESWITQGLIKYTNKWIDEWNEFSGNNFAPENASLQSIWINFQKSKEFNPEHVHGDADLSFVIYLKVPQQIIEDYYSFLLDKTHTGSPPGSITFKYGEHHDFAVAGKYICPRENTILMWPSYLRHAVPPFDCKGTRISVAGNLKFF